MAVGTDDPQAATVGRQRRVGALVEQDVVVIDRAVEAQAAVHDTAAVAGAQVSRDPVVIQPVVVGTGADRDTTRARRRAGEQRVAEAGVVRHGVVVDVHPGVELERNGRIRQHTRQWRAQWRRRRNTRTAQGAVIHVQRRCLAVAEIDAARQRAVVAEDAGVGHLEVVVPAMQEDAATTLRAVADREAIDARRVAQEVAGAIVAPGSARRAGRAIRRAVGQVDAAIRERAGDPAAV